MRAIVLTAAFVVAFAGASYAVDGVIEINQARALAGGVTPGDTPGFPVTISLPGSYRLSGSLNAGLADGIDVTAHGVTIDLNGFEIRVVHDGINGNGVSNLVITNGSINFVSRHGIVGLGNFGRVERVAIGAGGSPNTIGITATVHARISDCTVSGFYIGIKVGSGLLTGNDISGYGIWGIWILALAGYTGNVISAPPLHGFAAVIGNGVQLGPNLCGSALCP